MLINALLRLCSTEDEFNSVSDFESAKSCISNILSTLLCIAHVLPLACRSEEVLTEIFNPNSRYSHREQNFHEQWILNGWCDPIIQPARDAVLEYYKVSMYHLLLVIKLRQRDYLFSVTQIHRTLKTTCASVICDSLFLNFCTHPDPSLRVFGIMGPLFKFSRTINY